MEEQLQRAVKQAQEAVASTTATLHYLQSLLAEAKADVPHLAVVVQGLCTIMLGDATQAAAAASNHLQQAAAAYQQHRCQRADCQRYFERDDEVDGYCSYICNALDRYGEGAISSGPDYDRILRWNRLNFAASSDQHRHQMTRQDMAVALYWGESGDQYVAHTHHSWMSQNCARPGCASGFEPSFDLHQGYCSILCQATVRFGDVTATAGYKSVLAAIQTNEQGRGWTAVEQSELAQQATAEMLLQKVPVDYFIQSWLPGRIKQQRYPPQSATQA